MIKIEDAKRMKRSGQIQGVATRCSRFRQRERGGGGSVTDVRDRGRENARWQVCAFFRKRECTVAQR